MRHAHHVASQGLPSESPRDAFQQSKQRQRFGDFWGHPFARQVQRLRKRAAEQFLPVVLAQGRSVLAEACLLQQFIDDGRIGARVLTDVEPRQVKAEDANAIDPAGHFFGRKFVSGSRAQDAVQQRYVRVQFVGRRVRSDHSEVGQRHGLRLLQTPANHGQPTPENFVGRDRSQVVFQLGPLVECGRDFGTIASPRSTCRFDKLSDSNKA